jgi:uncharacterized membrane protein
MRRFFTSPLLAIVLLAAPIILVAVLYPSLPESIPVHFNAEGQADKYDHKSSIWLHTSILLVVGLGVYFLVSNIHKIDPKKNANVSVDTYKTIAMIVIVFLAVVNTSMVLSMSRTFPNFSIQKVVLPAVGLLMTIMGYFMRNIKPNYFIGLRLPWTLEDEDNWAATHQMAAKLWIPGGLVMAVAAILFPFMTAFIVMMVVTLVIVIIPVIYSYRFFKHKKA